MNKHTPKNIGEGTKTTEKVQMSTISKMQIFKEGTSSIKINSIYLNEALTTVYKSESEYMFLPW